MISERDTEPETGEADGPSKGHLDPPEVVALREAYVDAVRNARPLPPEMRARCRERGAVTRVTVMPFPPALNRPKLLPHPPYPPPFDMEVLNAQVAALSPEERAEIHADLDELDAELDAMTPEDLAALDREIEQAQNELLSALHVGDTFWAALEEHGWLQGGQRIILSEDCRLIFATGHAFHREDRTLTVGAISPCELLDAAYDDRLLISADEVWQVVTGDPGATAPPRSPQCRPR